MEDVVNLSCSCSECQKLCERNPGWPTPDEAERLLNDGHSGNLMLDFWVQSPRNVKVLAPATKGFEGKDAPSFSEMCHIDPMDPCKGVCVFFTKDRLCALHDTDMKPICCREGTACARDRFSSKKHVTPAQVKQMWDTERGYALIARWKEEVGYED